MNARDGVGPLLCIGVVAAALAGVAAPRSAAAQISGSPEVGRVRPEVRMDIISGRMHTVHAGGGLLWPAGRYVRIGIVAGAGTSRMRATPSLDDAGGESRWRPSARGEVIARFVLERREPAAWQLYGGGGVGMQGVEGAAPVARAFITLGVEPGAGATGTRPVIELGLGGGVRLGVALRATRRGAR